MKVGDLVRIREDLDLGEHPIYCCGGRSGSSLSPMEQMQKAAEICVVTSNDGPELWEIRRVSEPETSEDMCWMWREEDLIPVATRAKPADPTTHRRQLILLDDQAWANAWAIALDTCQEQPIGLHVNCKLTWMPLSTATKLHEVLGKFLEQLA